VRPIVLIDSGPLIALFDRSDRYHERVKSYLRTFHGTLLTTWPVLTEVSHLLDFHLQVQLDFLEWVARGGVEVYEMAQSDLPALTEMMRTYTNVPMDLADATLMYVAHREGHRRILSIDSDFDVYRMGRNGGLENVLWGRDNGGLDE